jgi:GH15 family glucan-1,4-alpha-glucosidase
MNTLHLARDAGLPTEPHAWQIQKVLLTFLESHWHEPDNGIWEIRGPGRHFTHSQVMAWVVFDRAVKAVENCGLDGPVDEGRRRRRVEGSPSVPGDLASTPSWPRDREA